MPDLQKSSLAAPAFRRQRGAFTLIELLVVVAIIAILIGILLPSLGRAREQARIAHCQSGLRQWGMAANYYMDDYNQYLPQEGSTGGNTDPGTWYNELPTYVNAPKYGEVYDGTTSVGTDGGYKNNWIWYCQSRLLEGKNSGTNINSFHYSWNSVLNGQSSTFTPDLTALARPTLHLKPSAISEPAYAPMIFESNRNTPSNGPSDDYPASSYVARKRHKGDSLNMLFIDIHIELVPGADVTKPTGDSAGTPAAWNGKQWNTNTNRRIVWGPWRLAGNP